MEIERRPSITVSGDKVVAAAFLRDAYYEMFKLEQYMSFNRLEQAKRGPVVVSASGVTVEVEKRFGDRFISINVPGGVVPLKEPRNICLCNCNFSLGWIVRQQSDTIDGAPLYTVMACNYKKRFAMYRDVLASDWAKYQPGQKILLVPYLAMAYLCCEQPHMQYGEEQGYGCRGIRSEDETSDEDWRTAYRIIPYMARMIPRVIEVRDGEV